MVVLSGLLGGTSLFAGESGQGLGKFIPAWTKGMAWTVEAQYRLKRGGEPGAHDGHQAWSEPVRWRYEVLERQRDLNLDVIRVRAEEVKSAGASTAGFIFLGEVDNQGKLKSLAMARAAFRPDDRPGEPESIDYTRMSTGPYPVVNDLSIVPADFPLFEGTERTEMTSSVTFHEITETHGGLHFARDVAQRVELTQVESDDERLRVPVPPSADVLEYTITRPSDRSAYRQLWTSASPWFLYSENGNMRAWLVDTD